MPGEYFEVEYSDDAVAHERIALWPVSESRWAVKTPDDDYMIEELDGSDPNTGPSLSRPLRRRAGGLAPLYRFRARLSDRAIRSSIVVGIRTAHAEADIAGMPAVTHVQSAGGAVVPLAEYLAGTQSVLMKEYLGRPAAPAGNVLLPVAGAPEWNLLVAADSPVDEVWLAAVAGGGTAAGSEVQPMIGRDVKFWTSEGYGEDRA